MGDEFANLVLGHAVIQGTLEVTAELLRAVEGYQGRDSDKAAVVLGEFRTFLDVTKENFLREIHELRHDGTKSFPGIC